MGTLASNPPPWVPHLEFLRHTPHNPDPWSIRPIAEKTMKLFVITLLPLYCLFFAFMLLVDMVHVPSISRSCRSGSISSVDGILILARNQN